MSKDNYERLFAAILKRGKVEDAETDEVYKFCEVVYCKHFIYRPDVKDDLIQEGFFGILKLLKETHYDPTKSAMNFIYTKVRNSMTDFLAKKTPDSLDDGYEQIASSSEGQYDDIVNQITKFIEDYLEHWVVTVEMQYYILTYFRDKFGVKVEIKDPDEVPLEFIIKYDYYVNYLEYLIMGHFMEGKMFDNDISDIIKILDHEGILNSPIMTIASTMDKKTLVKMFYVMSGNTIKYPSKLKLLRTDHYLSIYKSIESGRHSFEEASKFFGKPIDKIQYIYRRYKKIYYGERREESTRVLEGGDEDSGEEDE